MDRDTSINGRKKMAVINIYDLAVCHVTIGLHTAVSSGILIQSDIATLKRLGPREHCWIFLDKTVISTILGPSIRRKTLTRPGNGPCVGRRNMLSMASMHEVLRPGVESPTD